jgi:hypothetical protein
MMSRAAPLILLIAAIGFWSATTVRAQAIADDDALAAAMKDARATLQDGLKASQCMGTPISAKFEIDDGKLQLSVYTMKGDDFIQLVADAETGSIVKAEKITDAQDLKAATSQKAAMAKAKIPLLKAAEMTVKANPWFRAVSIFPELKNGEAKAEVTLFAGGLFKNITQQLDCGYENTLCY